MVENIEKLTETGKIATKIYHLYVFGTRDRKETIKALYGECYHASSMQTRMAIQELIEQISEYEEDENYIFFYLDNWAVVENRTKDGKVSVHDAIWQEAEAIADESV